MTQQTKSYDTIATQAVAALAEARKARHHRDCYCRQHRGRWCNAQDALWSRAADRCLQELLEKEPDDD